MLLNYTQIHELIDRGVIEGADRNAVNPASLDIHLGDTLLRESDTKWAVSLARRGSPQFEPMPVDPQYGWILWPDTFVLARSKELFHLPDDLAFEYKLTSSLARGGLNSALAGWADPGFHDASLTLELKNWLSRTAILLEPGMVIGQIIFWQCDPVPAEASYRVRGAYNGQRAPQPAKEKAVCPS